MAKDTHYRYYVEGECEVALLKTLRTDYQCIKPGKIEQFNVLEKKLTWARIRQLDKGTIVVLVFDTDTDCGNVLEENMKLLKSSHMVKAIFCITQVDNLEDELERSCKIKIVREITNSKSDSDFKRDFIALRNLRQKLDSCKFDFPKLWAKQPKKNYTHIENEADKIRIR